MGQKGRRSQLKEILKQNKVDIICLQETIKKEFTIRELQNLFNGQPFSWNWTEARGRSGGTLLGVKRGDFDAIEMDTGRYYSSILIANREDEFK